MRVVLRAVSDGTVMTTADKGIDLVNWKADSVPADIDAFAAFTRAVCHCSVTFVCIVKLDSLLFYTQAYLQRWVIVDCNSDNSLSASRYSSWVAKGIQVITANPAPLPKVP